MENWIQYKRKNTWRLALTFIDKPECCDTVDHINRNGLDNTLENLRWISSSDNAKNRTNPKKIRRGVDNGKPFEGVSILTSYLGVKTWLLKMRNLKNNLPYEDHDTDRIKNKMTGNFLVGHLHDNSYVKVGLTFTNGNDKTYPSIYLHDLLAMAFIENSDPDIYTMVDHIDRNKMNNDLSNLRWVTPSENGKNKKSPTEHRGVTFNKKEKLWRTRVSENGKRRIIGRYDTEEMAKRAYDKEEYKISGRTEYLNYPDEIEKTLSMETTPHVPKRSSKYRGVTWFKDSCKWISQIIVNKKHIYIGTYDTEEEAGLAYDTKAIELLGYDKAKNKLNFPERQTKRMSFAHKINR